MANQLVPLMVNALLPKLQWTRVAVVVVLIVVLVMIKLLLPMNVLVLIEMLFPMLVGHVCVDVLSS
jgi:hypothetical protein